MTNRRLARNVIYWTPKPNRDPHLTEDGEPKRRWPNRAAAQFVADIHRWKQQTRGRYGRKVPPSPYHCATCDGWHVGTKPDPNRHYRRVVDRESALVVELGHRALAQMLSESHGRDPLGAIVVRLPARRLRPVNLFPYRVEA